MTTRRNVRLLVLGQICITLLISLFTPTEAAIGVYNFTATATNLLLPITITYRLNVPGNVTIEIHDKNDAPVTTLGPYSESAGLHSHTWDNGGAAVAGGNYRALIKAANDGGSPTLKGTLVTLFPSKFFANSIYGVTIDRFPESPGYGTIYVGRLVAGYGHLLAYYADGTPKNWPASPNAVGNDLNLRCGTVYDAPWGLGVDKQGNIYCSCTDYSSAGGVFVFDSNGNRLYHVLTADPSGIVWLDGLAAPGGLEVYETKGKTVRYSPISGDHWTTAMDPGLTDSSIKANGICFEPGGTACYVGTSGLQSDASNPNPGVTRFVRQPDGSWAKDISFDCGLNGYEMIPYTAAFYAIGVSCDARDPDGAGPYTASSLWVALCGISGSARIARKALPNGELTVFTALDLVARFVAADSVGNVAFDQGMPPDRSVLWSRWGMAAPGGEPSTDERLTNWVTIATAAQRKAVNRIRDLKQEPQDSQVELSSARRVTAVFRDSFCIEEDDRTSGIRVKCGTRVSEGDLVRVGGRMSIEQGERCLVDAEVLTP